MPDLVVDSSAVLALILMEPGADFVQTLLPHGAISAANLCEVGTRLLDKGIPLAKVRATLDDLPLDVLDLTEADARDAAALRTDTRAQGLSLGDRCCLALARRLGVPAYTGDRRWLEAKLPLDIRLIR